MDNLYASIKNLIELRLQLIDLDEKGRKEIAKNDFTKIPEIKEQINIIYQKVRDLQYLIEIQFAESKDIVISKFDVKELFENLDLNQINELKSTLDKLENRIA